MQPNKAKTRKAYASPTISKFDLSKKNGFLVAGCKDGTIPGPGGQGCPPLDEPPFVCSQQLGS